MEFSSAHSAYQNVSRTGFRTFVKANGVIRELFTGKTDMHIGMSEVEIRCECDCLNASALYFGVPGERTAALARMLTVTNTGTEPVSLELLDGMSAIIPYGLNQDFLKNMSNLAKAWMQAEDIALGRTYFRVRASLEDGAVVREVKGGNFCLAWDEQGELLKPIVQPGLVFGQDTSLGIPQRFRETPLAQLRAAHQVTSNLFPCCFLPKEVALAPGESIRIFSIYGQAQSKEQVKELAERIAPETWFDAKRQEAARLGQHPCP